MGYGNFERHKFKYLIWTSEKFLTYDEQLAAFFRFGVNLGNTVNTADFFTVTYTPTVKFYPFGSARSPTNPNTSQLGLDGLLVHEIFQHGSHHEIVITGGPTEDITQLLAASKCVVCTNGILKASLENVVKEILARIAAYSMVRSYRSFPTVPIGRIIIDPVTESAEFLPYQPPKEHPKKKTKTAGVDADESEDSTSESKSDDANGGEIYHRKVKSVGSLRAKSPPKERRSLQRRRPPDPTTPTPDSL
ncbi:unnamed protein product [Caenorhabditis auriculariae]|uniref:Uncharacterized protein n=1 Tax=Caenorhabditis auriculariae TaxID=2777116 RepID=A0A8S1H2V8_9PELO|nr:unnamed protein product [Caenorhabditis auriculariae]